MDRREFLRRIVIASVLGVSAVSGVAVLAEKLASQTTSVNTLPLPSTSSQNSTSIASGQTTETAGSTASAKSTSTSARTTGGSTSSVPSGYILLAPLSAVNGKTFAYFTHPSFGSSILVNYGGTWKAFSAVCTHAGCTVNYSASSITCPCHPGVFSAMNGSVVSGPPPSKLAEYDVQIINNNLYVGSTVIN